MTPAPRLFCIGLNKTGTSSLHAALGILGYRSLHWGGPPARRCVRRAMAEGCPLLHHLDPEPEAVSDLEEVTHNFELADRQYPGSRFVLTVRELGAWLDSRRRHVEGNRRAQAAGIYAGGFVAVDPVAWEAEYRRHEARVLEYFRGPRAASLLVLDVTRGDGWAPLCAFLGRPVPPAPWPHENQGDPASRARIAQSAE